MTDMELHGHKPYNRQSDEPLSEYEMFVEWCHIPYSSRNLNNFCRRTGFPMRKAEKVHSERNWEGRSAAFDNDSIALRPDPALVEHEVALSGQKAAAHILLELGVNALELKNPAQISVGKAIKLIEKGAEIQRKAYDIASTEAQFEKDDLIRVNEILKMFGAEGIVDAEVVDEEGA